MLSTDNKPAVYVGTYGKYNGASIYGRWLCLDDYSDKEEFLQACSEIHADEPDPEFMFQDWQCIPDGLISESHIDDEVWDWLLLSADEQEQYTAFFELTGYRVQDVTWSEIQERYCGQYEDLQAYAWELAEMEFGEQTETALWRYFDIAAYTHDLDINGYRISDDGHVFDLTY